MTGFLTSCLFVFFFFSLHRLMTRFGQGDFSRTICHERTGRTFQIGPGNSYNNYPEIIETDIVDACNGIVHVIDEVMLPSAMRGSSGGGNGSAVNSKSSKNSKMETGSKKTTKMDSSKSTKSGYRPIQPVEPEQYGSDSSSSVNLKSYKTQQMNKAAKAYKVAKQMKYGKRERVRRH
jgi:hypothetical protein